MLIMLLICSALGVYGLFKVLDGEDSGFLYTLFAVVGFLIAGVVESHSNINEVSEVELLSKLEYDFIQKQSLTNSNYDLVLEMIKNKRTVNTIPVHPFCDSLPLVLKVSDKYSDARITLRYLLELYYLSDPKAALECRFNLPISIEEPTDLKHSIAISVSKIEELREVAEECNTAKVSFIVDDKFKSLTDEGADKIIKDCKLDKLREELNK